MPESPITAKRDASWFTFAAVAVAILLPAYLLGYNVLYTEGEVMQALYFLLLIAAGSSSLVSLYRRELAIRLVALLGGLLLAWQAYQSRKWAMIHEDIAAIVTHATKQRQEQGAFPKTIAELTFRHSFVRDHVYQFSSDEHGFRIVYFINHPGITYTYSSKDGYSYYPD